MTYAPLLDSLHPRSLVLEMARGIISPPEFAYDRELNTSFGFPPALLPIWSNGDLPGYLGMVKHWFGNRPSSFVVYYAEGRCYEEVALNEDQLRAWLTFDFLTNLPELAPVGAFAESVGLCAADEVEDYFAGIRETEDLLKLPVFSSDPPGILASQNPSWMRPFSGVALRDQLSSGDFEHAWLTMNGSGWELESVREALHVLLQQAQDGRFHELVAGWEAANPP